MGIYRFIVGRVVLRQYGIRQFGNTAMVRVPGSADGSDPILFQLRILDTVVFKSLLTQWVGRLHYTVIGREGNKAVGQYGNDRTPGPTASRMNPVISHDLSITLDTYPVCGFFEDRCQVPGSRRQGPGAWDPVPGTGAGPTPRAGHRAPRPSPATGKNPHTGFACYILPRTSSISSRQLPPGPDGPKIIRPCSIVGVGREFLGL